MSSTEKATRCMPISLGRVGSESIACGMDVFEELEATVAVWRLQHRDVGVVAVEADGGVRPFSTDRVPTEDGRDRGR